MWIGLSTYFASGRCDVAFIKHFHTAQSVAAWVVPLEGPSLSFSRVLAMNCGRRPRQKSHSDVHICSSSIVSSKILVNSSEFLSMMDRT